MSSALTSSFPAMPAFNGEPHPRRPLLPSPQPSFAPINTKLVVSHAIPFTLTPASASSMSSSRNSLASTQSHMGTNGSLQSTPEGLIPVSSPSLPNPVPLSLYDFMSNPSAQPTAMAAAMSKGSGLIRRASRGAQQIPGKFRRKGSNAHRDSSSGPVIMRRRSDSRGVADANSYFSDSELNLDDEEAVDDLPDSNADCSTVGMSSNRPSVHPLSEGSAVAPIRNSKLEQGTNLAKITKKKRKDIKFRLNFDSAKVYWDPSRPSKQFYIDDVREIRIGEEARNYREECGCPESCEPFWFTIIYSDPSRSKGRPLKTIHLVAPDTLTFDLWTRTLESVSRHRIEMMAGLAGSAEKSAKTVWRRAMDKKFEGANHAEDDELMDIAGVIKLCRSLHINCTEAMLREYFAEADSNHSNTLNQAQFLYFVKRLKERKDIKLLYHSLVKPSDSEIDKEVFFSFLKKYQGINLDLDVDYWTAVFERYARASSKATPPSGGAIPLPPTMNFSSFQAFLSSPANSVYAPASAEPRLTRPLNEYFISSSHNTYLLGRQVAGESSTEAYIDALQKGCRCIEIDCWDGSDGNPIVLHGRTFTSSISFSDTIKVVDKYAFCESVYPLIISLEVHCSPEQQALMADIMIKVFGDKLVLKPLDSNATVLPSPEELKNKILIKVKAAAEKVEESLGGYDIPAGRRQRSLSSPWSRPTVVNDQISSTSLMSTAPIIGSPERSSSWMTTRTFSSNATLTAPILLSSAGSADDSDGAAITPPGEKKRKKTKTSNIVKVLGELGVYTRGFKFSSFSSHDASTHNHVFSFAERTFDKLCKPGAETKQLLEEHNMRSLMRVYPSYHRINSSNFDPMKFWRRGVQMAALNWQTYDLGQQINEAMFAAGNDRTGYVLKPAELRDAGRRKAKQRVQFSVDIISAQQLPRPRGLSVEASINPYVEFEMYSAEDKGRVAMGEGGQDASARNGLSGIGQPLRKRTQIFAGNGYDPSWKETITMTLATRYPSLVFVRWTVWNSVDGRNVNSTPLASFTAKLSSLQQGYRHLPLFDINGEQYLFSTLFCKIKKEDSIEIHEANPLAASSVEPMSPMQELANPQSKATFFRKVFSRTPSGRKRRKDDRQPGETRDSDPGAISRSSTLER